MLLGDTMGGLISILSRGWRIYRLCLIQFVDMIQIGSISKELNTSDYMSLYDAELF